MSSKDISVIFSTYNRADMLRQTLEAMTLLDREGLDVEFVVVDNNSKDDTSQVIDSFIDRLPLTHLFEPRPGKNCALNHALDHVSLGNIVVFTDDDIVPCEDWLQQISAACERWTEYSVFGGKIEPIWPEGVEVPQWAQESQWLCTVMFATHDLGDKDQEYADGVPLGPNFWVRRAVFRGARRYDEHIGPRPGSYKMGSETSFLMQLAADGFSALYVHDAPVGHHVQPALLSEAGLVGRFIRKGRGIAPTGGVNRPELLSKSRTMWHLRTFVAIASSCFRMLAARLLIARPRRTERVAFAAMCLGYDLESFKEVWNGSRQKKE